MKFLPLTLIGLLFGSNAYSQVRGSGDLPIYDPNAGVALTKAAYREVCLGDKPALLIYGEGLDKGVKVLTPIGAIPWPADKPNPCKGHTLQK